MHVLDPLFFIFLLLHLDLEHLIAPLLAEVKPSKNNNALSVGHIDQTINH